MRTALMKRLGEQRATRETISYFRFAGLHGSNQQLQLDRKTARDLRCRRGTAELRKGVEPYHVSRARWKVRFRFRTPSLEADLQNATVGAHQPSGFRTRKRHRQYPVTPGRVNQVVPSS